MHDDVWLCLMMFDDVCWCLMMFDDVWWCVMMLADAWWCLMMCHDASWWLGVIAIGLIDIRPRNSQWWVWKMMFLPFLGDGRPFTFEDLRLYWNSLPKPCSTFLRPNNVSVCCQLLNRQGTNMPDGTPKVDAMDRWVSVVLIRFAVSILCLKFQW